MKLQNENRLNYLEKGVLDRCIIEITEDNNIILLISRTFLSLIMLMNLDIFSTTESA